MIDILAENKTIVMEQIEEQMEMDTEGLLDEDLWMMEMNLGDTETTLGEQEEYWLVAIRAAREAATLTRQRTQQAREEPRQEGH